MNLDLPIHSGHFEFESGHHAMMWMDLETLFLRPEKVEPMAIELSKRLASYNTDVICGPLVEGAFLALSVARHLSLPFTYSERFERNAGREARGLFRFGYRIPRTLHPHVAGKRVAIVNDVISAGSAVRGTARDLESIGANVVAIGALLVLGDWKLPYALEALETRPNELWTPAECPMCARGEPLERRYGSGSEIA